MGLFFSDNKKKVSRREFGEEVRKRLYNYGFNRKEVDHVAMIFRSDLNEPEKSQAGIDSNEIDRGIGWMRKNKKIHKISDSKIDSLEKILQDNL